MKNIPKFFAAVLFFSVVFNFKSQAGPGPKEPVTGSVDVALQLQIDSIKAVLDKQGFIVVKEAVMAMESEYESPVIVPLREGSWYHIVFIGDVSSKLHEIRMYDNDEKQVVYQKKYGDGFEGGNIINYPYTPKFSEYHIIKPVQVNKKKEKYHRLYTVIQKGKINILR